MSELHEKACGLRLIRFAGDKTHYCEPVYFVNGRNAVDTVLRRARLSGRVEIDGEVVGDKAYQADVLIGPDGEWDQHVALDAKSYSSLKNHWMRCKVDAVE
jgi:hypothetical protein